ncbi:inner membrane protein YhjD [Corynebacterium sp. ES2794-CONJ1]|uniref:inner membrane protein YhjD n=1 Tax=unclassified Corynebacterium TaxID=2624378 RepID=UPI0021677409|nr:MULTISPECIES: inner membrane protein YhjD [unclassified Corynebacterium]MCS4489526.1 inner membrane protein YhjD [Corynebacterium sp. ES2775-CONJ]MCS4491463.1 inner membrane protein YhjD [Corynebacterium sp. ES2715-CONJ3]MCS4531436.1 inner membrane protein YhjD [Corynebacterium sp. ES2730-CONJ]MCU9518824.1 inner membrane protein YhjD [Corynebacterium sp. ES2794-CONJ1]
MATNKHPVRTKEDEYGIERATEDKKGLMDKYRAKWGWFDHVMLMTERYTQNGGNQFAAGITYFSVLSMFPILMLIFAGIATVLASRPELLADINERITAQVSGQMGETLNEIIDTAIEQRGAMFGIGGITALWSGLNWVFHLTTGISMIWNYPIKEENFFKTKLNDFIRLIALLVLMIVAIGITVIGSSGLTSQLIEFLGLEDIPGIQWMTTVVALALGILANFLVFFWLMKRLPRGPVPMKSAFHASIIGALAFEVFKQLGSLFFSNALSNPAGATFGPIIGVMVLFYFIWRIVLYCSAWAATTPEALAIAKLDPPPPAIIRVREQVKVTPLASSSGAIGSGLALGAAVTGVVSFFLKKK